MGVLWELWKVLGVFLSAKGIAIQGYFIVVIIYLECNYFLYIQIFPGVHGLILLILYTQILQPVHLLQDKLFLRVILHRESPVELGSIQGVF